MKSGDLCSRVAFYTTTTASDGAGGQTSTDALVIEVWANVVKVGAGRNLETGKITESGQYRITVRYNSAFVPGFAQRVYYSEKWYTVNSITNNDPAWVEIIATINE